MTPEQFIVYTARVSNPSNQMNTDTAEKLLSYLVRHSHWSPFDMVDMILEIECPRAIGTQILRHWSFRFQEFSQRYAVVSPEHRASAWDHVEVRFAHSGGNRQGSSEVGPAPMGLTHDAQLACAESMSAYQKLIRSDIAPESARMVLPLATLTTMYMKGSVRSWMTYFWQRLDPHAQKEHRELAEQMFTIFAAHFPITANLVKSFKPTMVPVE